jgi:hypothetical protein
VLRGAAGWTTATNSHPSSAIFVNHSFASWSLAATVKILYSHRETRSSLCEHASLPDEQKARHRTDDGNYDHRTDLVIHREILRGEMTAVL